MITYLSENQLRQIFHNTITDKEHRKVIFKHLENITVSSISELTVILIASATKCYSRHGQYRINLDGDYSPSSIKRIEMYSDRFLNEYIASEIYDTMLSMENDGCEFDDHDYKKIIDSISCYIQVVLSYFIKGNSKMVEYIFTAKQGGVFSWMRNVI